MWSFVPRLIASAPCCDADFLSEIQGVVDHLGQLLQHIICGRSVSPVDGHLHNLKELEFTNALVITAIGCL